MCNLLKDVVEDTPLRRRDAAAATKPPGPGEDNTILDYALTLPDLCTGKDASLCIRDAAPAARVVKLPQLDTEGIFIIRSGGELEPDISDDAPSLHARDAAPAADPTPGLVLDAGIGALDYPLEPCRTGDPRLLCRRDVAPAAEPAPLRRDAAPAAEPLPEPDADRPDSALCLSAHADGGALLRSRDVKLDAKRLMASLVDIATDGNLSDLDADVPLHARDAAPAAGPLPDPDADPLASPSAIAYRTALSAIDRTSGVRGYAKAIADSTVSTLRNYTFEDANSLAKVALAALSSGITKVSPES